jgi:hypothetical protein
MQLACRPGVPSGRPGRAGAIAARIGVPATFLLNGCIAFTAALLFLRGLPALRMTMRPDYEKLGLLRGGAE